MTAGAPAPGLAPTPSVPDGPGVPLRVTLASPRPLTDALVAHVTHLLAARSPEVAVAHGRLGPLRTVGYALRVPTPEPGSAGSPPEQGGPGAAGSPAVGAASEGAARALRDEVRGPATALGVDVAVTTGPLAEAGPALIVTDVDSTLLTGEVIELVAAHAGVEVRVAEITERAMRGELNFEESLRERVALLAGLEAGPVLAGVRDAVELSPGAREMFLHAHRAGVATGVVSGGFAEIVAPTVEPLGVRFVAANRFEVGDDGLLTGRTVGEVVGREAKARHVREWCAELGVGPERAIAAGDGANDLDMLHLVGLGVAYRGKPVVVEEADAFVTGDRLDTVLALAGVTDP